MASDKPTASKFFHAAVGAFLIVFTVWGFHHFFLQGRAYPGRELTPPIKTLVIMHGISMALWMLLMFAQPLLVAIGKRSVHMLVGKVGAGIAALIVILGFKLGVESARVAPPEAVIWGLSPKQFMSVPVLSIILFAALVAAAVFYRRRPEIHRSLMLLATMAAMSAAISRIDVISNLYLGTIWARLFGPFFVTLLIAVLFIPAKWLVSRTIDRTYALGCFGLILYDLFIVQIAPTGAWDAVAGMLLG